jgi:hypothetical protein
MALQLAPDEPEAGPWRAESLTVAAATVMQPGQGKGAGHRPVVLAVDGRSSSGKTTLAGRLRDVVTGSAVVHTDDIAWWHSRFGWADLLTDGVLLPARAGQPVTFRPPQWDQRQRPGAIEVPAGCPRRSSWTFPGPSTTRPWRLGRHVAAEEDRHRCADQRLTAFWTCLRRHWTGSGRVRPGCRHTWPDRQSLSARDRE